MKLYSYRYLFIMNKPSHTSGTKIFFSQADIIKVSKIQQIYCYFMENASMDFQKVRMRKIIPYCLILITGLSFRPKKKNYLLPSKCPGEIFFLTMQPVIFVETPSELKKNIKQKKKTEIKRKMLGHSSLLTFFIYIYKSQIHMFQLM